MYKLDIWGKLGRISEFGYPPLNQCYSLSQIPPTHIGRSVVTVEHDLARVEDVKQYMLEHLRKSVPYYLNVWRTKKFNMYDQQLSLGGGRHGINYKLSTANQSGFASIYLHFERSQMELYNQLKRKLSELQLTIHPDLTAWNRKIGVRFFPESNLDATINRLASILKNMLEHLRPYLYYGGGRQEDEDLTADTQKLNEQLIH